MELLQATAAGSDEFAFVPAATRKKAEESVAHGIQCILATQIIVDGKRTVWCQQHDPLTLQPASARNYEMPSQSASESAKILLFLMALPHPTAAEVSAINAAGAWLTRVAISRLSVASYACGTRSYRLARRAADLGALLPDRHRPAAIR